MAMTETLSLASGNLLLIPTTTSLLHHPSVAHPSNLSIPHQPFYANSLSTRYKTRPTTFICNAKLGDTDPEGIGDVFFDDNYDMMIEEDEEDDDEEDETESSIDLFIRFLQSMFKKLSKRAKKASRSILPAVISPQLVSFAVDGILLLAVLSILKALLEVVCTLGSTVFSAILFLRVIWAAISYFKSSGSTSNQGGNSFGTTQPAA